MKKLLLFSLCVVISIDFFGQQNKKALCKVSGSVVSSLSEKPILYATISVRNKQNVIIATKATDILGHFAVNLKPAIDYTIIIDAMGYRADSIEISPVGPLCDVGSIKLVEGQVISEVTVSAKRLVIKEDVDRIIYYVSLDPEAKKLKIADIMKKIPLITSDPKTGKLMYANEKIPTILINGRPNEMLNSARQYPMRMVKADIMNRVELIMPHTKDNSSDNTILNIVLDRDFPNGYVTELTFAANTRNLYSGNIDLVTKFGNLYLSTVYNIGKQNRAKLNTQTTKENLLDNSIYLFQNNNSKIWGKNNTQNLNLGIQKQLSKDEEITLSLGAVKLNDDGYSCSDVQNINSEGVVVENTNTQSITNSYTTPRLNGSISYYRGLWVNHSINISYRLTNAQNSNIYLIKNSFDCKNPINNQSSQTSNSAVDQSYILCVTNQFSKESSLITTANYTNRRYNNSTELLVWDYDNQPYESVNIFQEGLDYTQKVYSITSNYSYTDRKLSLGLQIAGENMSNKGIYDNGVLTKLDYADFQLFPTASILYNTSHKYKIGLRYSTRTLRPNITYLDPFEDKTDPNNIKKGNPNLRAEYTHRFDFTINKVFNNGMYVSFLTNNEITNNAIEKYTTINDNGSSVTTYSNSSNKYSLFLRLNLTTKPYSWLTIVNSVSYNHILFTGQSKYGSNRVSGAGYIGKIDLSLSKNSKIYSQFSIAPQMSFAQTQEVKYFSMLSLSYSQTLVKDKLYLTINLDDPFNKHSIITNVIGSESFIMTTRRQQLGRVLGFSLSWNFGHLRDKGKFSSKMQSSPDLSRPTL